MLNFSGGMSRRHFLSHCAAGSAATMGAAHFLTHLEANQTEVRKNQKACILIWLGGGAPTIDMWDLKPNSKNGGEFKPISTKGDLQISEHMPETAKQMNNLSVVRSMSTREADHARGTYFMHTAYVPNPTVVHPAFGSVVSREIGSKRKDLAIPAFVSIGGGGMSPGFMGMAHAPLAVNQNGQIDNLTMNDDEMARMKQRLVVLESMEDGFIKSNRGDTGQAHKEVYSKAINLFSSKQMDAFKVSKADSKELAHYRGASTGAGGGMMGGGNGFSDSLLMARRLVEVGVPFVEVRGPGGWDLHNNVFQTLSRTNLPQLDKGIAALTSDLKQRGMLDDVCIVCMSEFGRTPRINQNTGRDHWAQSWSVMIGGGGLRGGVAVGETDEDGIRVESNPYLPGDIWSTVSYAMRIPLDTVHTSKNGRPMKLANGGNPIKELIV